MIRNESEILRSSHKFFSVSDQRPDLEIQDLYDLKNKL